jgi:hypothetical protein
MGNTLLRSSLSALFNQNKSENVLAIPSQKNLVVTEKTESINKIEDNNLSQNISIPLNIGYCALSEFFPNKDKKEEIAIILVTNSDGIYKLLGGFFSIKDSRIKKTIVKKTLRETNNLINIEKYMENPNQIICDSILTVFFGLVSGQNICEKYDDLVNIEEKRQMKRFYLRDILEAFNTFDDKRKEQLSDEEINRRNKRKLPLVMTHEKKDLFIEVNDTDGFRQKVDYYAIEIIVNNNNNKGFDRIMKKSELINFF